MKLVTVPKQPHIQPYVALIKGYDPFFLYKREFCPVHTQNKKTATYKITQSGYYEISKPRSYWKWDGHSWKQVSRYEVNQVILKRNWA